MSDESANASFVFIKNVRGEHSYEGEGEEDINDFSYSLSDDCFLLEHTTQLFREILNDVHSKNWLLL